MKPSFPYVKLFFKDLVEAGADWPPVDTESLWATPCGVERFRVANIPAYVRGLAFGDVVRAFPDSDGNLTATEVVEHNGHSTFRVLTETELPPERLSEILQSLVDGGATYQKAKDNLWTFDVADPADIKPVQKKLQEWSDQGALDYEEGYLAR